MRGFSFRVARNWLQHGVPSFNLSGPPVEGMTNLLWTLASAGWIPPLAAGRPHRGGEGAGRVPAPRDRRPARAPERPHRERRGRAAGPRRRRDLAGRRRFGLARLPRALRPGDRPLRTALRRGLRAPRGGEPGGPISARLDGGSGPRPARRDAAGGRPDRTAPRGDGAPPTRAAPPRQGRPPSLPGFGRRSGALPLSHLRGPGPQHLLGQAARRRRGRALPGELARLRHRRRWHRQRGDCRAPKPLRSGPLPGRPCARARHGLVRRRLDAGLSAPEPFDPGPRGARGERAAAARLEPASQSPRLGPHRVLGSARTSPIPGWAETRPTW